MYMCRPPLPPRARGVDCNICLRLQHNGRRHNKTKTRESIRTTIRRYNKTKTRESIRTTIRRYNKTKTRESIRTTIRRYNKTKTREVYTNDKTTQPIFQYHYRKRHHFEEIFFF